MYKLFICMLILVFCGCRDELLSVSSEVEANRILLSLREQEVDARKLFTKGTWVINVDAASFTKSLEILEKKRIYYRSAIENRTEGKDDLFASRTEKNARLIEKTSKDLALTLLMFPGIIDAKVHLFKDEKADVVSSLKVESASVVLLAERDNMVDHEHIKTIVSKGSGVPKEAVFVVEKVSNFQKTEEQKSSPEKLPPISVNKINLETKSELVLFGIGSLFIVVFSIILIRSRIKTNHELEIISKATE